MKDQAAEMSHLMWNMTRKCNFRCEYCYFPHDPSPVTENLDPEAILSMLEEAGGPWVVEMTGGEPFLYPGFVDIVKKLTSRHLVGMDSNLSVRSKVKRFAEEIDPAKVVDIYAALHIKERERLGLKQAFIEDVLMLLEKGFTVSVNYVFHPSLDHRFADDVAYFAERGVKILPRPFKGSYEGRDYPAGYTDQQRALLGGKLKTGKKMVFNFKGVPCSAGKRLLRLEPDGQVLRCSGDLTRLGRVGEGVSPMSGVEPCKVSRCPCYGPDYVILDQFQEDFLKGLTSQVVGNLARAEEIYSRLAAGDDSASNAMNNLALLLKEKGDRRAALDWFKKAAALNPGNKIYTRNLVCALAGEGERMQAAQVLEAYLAERPDKQLASMFEALKQGRELPEAAGLCVDVISQDNPRDIFPAA